MFPGFQILPEQASTLAPRVDNLYFFIVAVTAFFAVAVTVAGIGRTFLAWAVVDLEKAG